MSCFRPFNDDEEEAAAAEIISTSSTLKPKKTKQITCKTTTLTSNTADKIAKALVASIKLICSEQMNAGSGKVHLITGIIITSDSVVELLSLVVAVDDGAAAVVVVAEVVATTTGGGTGVGELSPPGLEVEGDKKAGSN